MRILRLQSLALVATGVRNRRPLQPTPRERFNMFAGDLYQNGRLERLHLALEEVVGTPLEIRGRSSEPIDLWRRTTNEVRPHVAPGMRCPVEIALGLVQRPGGNHDTAYRILPQISGQGEAARKAREMVQRKAGSS